MRSPLRCGINQLARTDSSSWGVEFHQITEAAQDGSGPNTQRIIHELCWLHVLMAHPQTLGDFRDAPAIFWMTKAVDEDNAQDVQRRRWFQEAAIQVAVTTMIMIIRVVISTTTSNIITLNHYSAATPQCRSMTAL